MLTTARSVGRWSVNRLDTSFRAEPIIVATVMVNVENVNAHARRRTRHDDNWYLATFGCRPGQM
jgi:hypothetical protein